MVWSSKASLRNRYAKGRLGEGDERKGVCPASQGVGRAWYQTGAICSRKSKEIKSAGMELKRKKVQKVEVLEVMQSLIVWGLESHWLWPLLLVPLETLQGFN